VFSVDEFGSQGKKGFADFAPDGALWSQEGGFDELLGDGGAAFEAVAEEIVSDGAGDALEGEAGVGVETFVFDGQVCLADVGGEVVEVDGSPISVGVDFVENLAVSIHNNGRNGKRLALEAGGRGEVLEDIKRQADNQGDGESQEGKDDFFAAGPGRKAFELGGFEGKGVGVAFFEQDELLFEESLLTLEFEFGFERHGMDDG